jgi:hypothetical protein
MVIFGVVIVFYFVIGIWLTNRREKKPNISPLLLERNRLDDENKKLVEKNSDLFKQVEHFSDTNDKLSLIIDARAAHCGYKNSFR